MLSRRRSLGMRKVPVTAFFLVLGFVAIFAGYLLGKYVVGTLIGSTKIAVGSKEGASQAEGQDVLPSGAREISLSPITLYRVQLGAFSSRQNAEDLAAKVLLKGYPAHVLGYSPYRVLGGVFGTREAAARAADRLKAAGFEVYVSGMQVGGLAVPLTNAPEDYSLAVEKSLGKIMEAVRLGASAWDEYAVRGQVANAEAARQLAADLKEASAALSAGDAPAAWRDTGAQIQEIISLAASCAEGLVSMADAPSSSGYATVATGYMKLVEGYQDCLSVAASTAAK